MIVDPKNHISESDIDDIHKRFERARGDKRELGPPLYIVAPYDKVDDIEDTTSRNHESSKLKSWYPSTNSPEWVVVGRAVALARRSHQFLIERVVRFDQSAEWSAVFHESPSSFHSFDALLRVKSDFIIDMESSSTGLDLNPHSDADGMLVTSYTRSMTARIQGPKSLRLKVYKNLHQSVGDNDLSILLSWQPIQEMIAALSTQYGEKALFFHNELTPEVVGIVWRPDSLKPMQFSARAEYCMPQDPKANNWKNDSMVVLNKDDLIREMREFCQDFVTTAKIMDLPCRATKKLKAGRD